MVEEFVPTEKKTNLTCATTHFFQEKKEKEIYGPVIASSNNLEVCHLRSLLKLNPFYKRSEGSWVYASFIRSKLKLADFLTLVHTVRVFYKENMLSWNFCTKFYLEICCISFNVSTSYLISKQYIF